MFVIFRVNLNLYLTNKNFQIFDSTFKCFVGNFTSYIAFGNLPPLVFSCCVRYIFGYILDILLDNDVWLIFYFLENQCFYFRN